MGSVKLFPNWEAALKGVFNRVLTELSVSLGGNEMFGDEGAKAIAEALKVNSVLTKLYLCNNNLGRAGEKAVRDAVKDRSGFVLEL